MSIACFRPFKRLRSTGTRQEADIAAPTAVASDNRQGLLAGPLLMELAGLEPATSWVRSRFEHLYALHVLSSFFTKFPICRHFEA